MQYIIKKHLTNPFDIGIYDHPITRSIGMVGYLGNIDLFSLNYQIVQEKEAATKLSLYDVSLLASKLNKLNLNFYEIEESTH
jgi:hypothetical protein